MSSPTIDIAGLHPVGRHFKLLARIDGWKLFWAGQYACELQTAIGPLQVMGNRDVLGNVDDGAWTSSCLRRDDQGVRVVRRSRTAARRTTPWLPSVACGQPKVLRQLRQLLGSLSPRAQALFMSVMSDPSTQRRLFSRPAALDHHNFPGGLFAQSVQAAELAYIAAHADDTERDAATLAALLFDLGKLCDDCIGFDLPRQGSDLQPHLLTQLRVLPACDLIEPHDAPLAWAVRSLLAPGSDADTGGLQRLRETVQQAVQHSWTHPSEA